MYTNNMTVYDQVKNIFTEMFDVAGFESNQNREMVNDVLNIWVAKSLFKLFDILNEEEKNRFSVILDKLSTGENKDQDQKDFIWLINNLDEDRKSKAMEIIFDEAGSLTEDMMTKFNLKSSDEQKTEFAKRVSAIIKV